MGALSRTLPVFGGLSVLLLWGYLLGTPLIAKSVAAPPIDEVCIQTGPCFNVTLADTPEKRARGLMYRTFLAPQEGMLFVFDREDIYPFWMKDTLISLDMIWISKDQKIVDIATETLPMSTRSIIPTAKARYVLEVTAGTTKRLGMKVGDKLHFYSQKRDAAHP